MRKQAGYIFQKSGWWYVRYRENVMESGQLVRRQIARQIAPVAAEHKRLKRPPEENPAASGADPSATESGRLYARGYRDLGRICGASLFPEPRKPAAGFHDEGIPGALGFTVKSALRTFPDAGFPDLGRAKVIG